MLERCFSRMIARELRVGFLPGSKTCFNSGPNGGYPWGMFTTPKITVLPLTVALSVSFATLWAQTPQPKAAAKPATDFPAIAPRVELKDGDSFVFLGDSITHQCLYTQYVEDYIYTRFPQKRIRFHNAGVGGDVANDALVRFDEDVAAYRPNVVTILLGMNDGRYRPYDQAVFDTYQEGMNKLLDRIQGLEAKAVPMTPTMHDARAARMGTRPSEPRDTYYNGVLSLYGTWLREVAQQRGLGFVDMYSPLNNHTMEQRRTQPNWTMIKDAVHPDPAGQLVMAAALITDLFPKTQVGSVVLSKKPDGSWGAATGNGKVSELEGNEEGLRFTMLTNSLPWVVPADAAEGFKLTSAGHRLSNEKLTARNLPAGKYEVRIDGKSIGQWTEGQLAFGVEIELNAETPQYAQARQVAELNQRRNIEVYKKIRDEYGQLKRRRRVVGEQEGKPDFEKARAEFETWRSGMADRVKSMLAEAKRLEDEIYVVNQPQPHRYEIAPVKAAPKN